MKALEKHGVGNWRDISEQYLPKWDDQAIRIKASRLIGSQSLARYVGWKGNRYTQPYYSSQGLCSEGPLSILSTIAHSTSWQGDVPHYTLAPSLKCQPSH